MSGFSSLNTAITGLSAAQRGLDTAGQNIVNANTPGYSRQRLALSSAGSATTATFHTGNRGVYGGVNVEGVFRVRDAFLESTRASAGGTLSALTAQANALADAERLLAEPGDAGLQAVLDDFFTAWHDLAARPTDAAAGAVVIQRGTALAGQLHYVNEGLSEQWTTARQTLEGLVAEANQAASDLANLNQRISESVVADRPANELMDRRDQLVRQLADLLGGVAVPGDDGMVSVSVNGVAIVSGAHAESFSLTGGLDITDATTDPPTVSWGSVAVPVAGGKAAGLLSALRTDLPGLSASLDAVAVALRDSVNALHGSGFTLAGAAGGDFFSGTGAGDLSVVPVSAGDLAVASASGLVDGANALLIGDLIDEDYATSVLGGAGASERWRDLSSGLGVTLQALERSAEVQESVVAAADTAVAADAGVDLDEEMTSLILWQRAYEAAARVITTADEMLDVLVNRTGLVGR